MEWRPIADCGLGGAEMQEKVRDAFEQNRSNPESFIKAVSQIKRSRSEMVERIRSRLEELEFLNGPTGPSEDELFDLATNGLSDALQHRASDIVDVFRDYLTTPAGLFS
jgi:hypothetical protein